MISKPLWIDKLTLFGISVEGKNDVEIRKLRFISTFFLAGLFACISSLILGLVVGNSNFNYGAVFVATAGFITLRLILQITKRFDLVVQITLAALNVLCIYLLLWDNFGTAVMWCFVHGIIAGLLLNWKKALTWAVFYLTTIVIITSNVALNNGSPRSTIYIFTFVISYIGLTGFAMAYQRIVEASEKTIQQNQIEMNTLNEKLQQELVFSNRSKKALDGLSSSLSKQNNKLVQSKTALVNLLEDARELEKELVDAKKNVEQKVIQRTQELSVERARLNSTLQSLPIAVLLVETNGKVVDANNQAYELIGETEDSISKKNAHSKLRHLIKNHFKLVSYIERCGKNGSCMMVPEIEFEQEFYKVALGPVKAHDDSISDGVVVVIENITAQKLLDRSKDEFLMIASHELRTPLTAIRGNATVLASYINDAKHKKDAHDLVDDITGSSERLLGIVNDYLELSSMEQGKLPFKTEKSDLAAICQRVINENRTLADGKKLKLSLEKPRATQVLVKADSDRVQQVIQNLVSNAVHYTAKGSVTVQLSVGEDKVTCRVRDTGAGISKLGQKNLFDKFNQAQENLLTRDPERSTGLGLYIAKLMIDKMHGSLILESSALRKGSVFAFSLPRYARTGTRSMAQTDRRSRATIALKEN